jgi:hypothetical protein
MPPITLYLLARSFSPLLLLSALQRETDQRGDEVWKGMEVAAARKTRTRLKILIKKTDIL